MNGTTTISTEYITADLNLYRCTLKPGEGGKVTVSGWFNNTQPQINTTVARFLDGRQLEVEAKVGDKTVTGSMRIFKVGQNGIGKDIKNTVIAGSFTLEGTL